MNNELQIIDLSDFEDYLVKNQYSKHVIPMYIRKVKEFLECNDVYLYPWTDYNKLKDTISGYLANILISYQKGMIQAALHTYYCFVTENQFIKRLCVKNFDKDTSIESEIERFRKYLKEKAGLSVNTVISQCNTVKTFLYSSFPEKNFSPEEVAPDHVRTYFLNTLRHVSKASKKTIIVRIRSYIKFLGLTGRSQSEEILKLPMTSLVWKHSGLPKYLTDAEFRSLISTYDKSSPAGIRNYAIIRCLKDLGLRCSEVAGLSLDDFDWIQGTVTIKKTKSSSARILPLHTITGQAIESYLLHSRPHTIERILFVRFKNKQGQAMGTSQIRNTVRSAAIRAGLEHFTGTHMLRHTTAKEMINSGIDLKTIADILGHKSIETTSIYAKLNFIELQDVAGTWPEVNA